MYVIMDLEWVDCLGNIPCLTQIAALRIDNHWNRLDMFASLICPLDKRGVNWGHMGYTGGNKKSFLSAPSAISVLRSLKKWLRDDDVLLWWGDDPANVFETAVKHMLKQELTHSVKLLYHAADSITGIKGSAYKIAETLQIAVPDLPHVSTNDVEVIRLVMKKLMPDPSGISPSPWRKSASALPSHLNYFYDHVWKRLHTANGGCVQSGAYMQGFRTLESCIKRSMKPCPVCCAKAYRKESARISAEAIAVRGYNFVYRKSSEVFHTADCVHARRIPFNEIKGFVKYKTCESLNKRPCRLCNPNLQHESKASEAQTADFLISTKPSAPKEKILPGMTRELNDIEKRAYKRHIQATHEREAQASNNSNPDFWVRTSSAYVFWAARGYSTFHLGNCPKLAGLKELRGFARYNQATGKGLAPCKWCKPSRKQDLQTSIPSGGKIRNDETIEALDHLCDTHGYAHKLCESVYYISTPVGKWRLHTEKRPVELWHINLVSCWGKIDEYHKQPRMLLSLTDTFYYIHDHDKALMRKTTSGKTAAPIKEICYG